MPQHSALSTQRSRLRRVLVRGPNWIGDAVMCEPALRLVRTLYPSAEITLLVKPTVAGVFADHPAVNHLVVYDHRGRHAGLSGKWTLARDLRKAGYDLAILFQNAFEAALIAYLAGIPRRYGYATDGRSLLLTDAVAVTPERKAAHQVAYYVEMLRPLGTQGPPSPPRLSDAGEIVQAMTQRLAGLGIGPEDVLIGVNPGSTYGGAKRWLPERFAEAADRLVREHVAGSGRRARVVLVGAPGEEPLATWIADRMVHKPVVLTGQTSVGELTAVVRRCAVFLTNDTGPMHIAAALGVPVVAVFGPTDHRRTAPFGEGHVTVRHPVECSPCLLRECPIDHRCMTGVTVDDVVRTARDVLAMQNGKTNVINGGAELDRGVATTQHSALPSTRLGALRHSKGSTQPMVLRGVTVFLDRDGTLNRDPGYLTDPEALELLPGVVQAVARLNHLGARVVLVTNQSGVARGMFSLETLASIHARLCALLEQGGAFLDGIYFCPHHPDEGCACRKPGTGLIERAVADLGLDLSCAYVVGDQKQDIELAVRVGARSVLVTTGQTNVHAVDPLGAKGWPPDRVAEGLPEAVDWILEDVAARHVVSE